MDENFNELPELDEMTNLGSQGNYVAVDLQGTGIDLDVLRAGKETEFSVNPSSVDLPENEESRYFEQEELFKQLNYECIDDGCDSSDEKSTPFEKIKKGMEDITGCGLVLKKIMKQGSGTVIPPNSLCRVHYNGYIEYSDEPFDSSRLRGKQHQFKLGSGEGIEGWQIAISTMKRGEISRFLLHPTVAFGKMGCPPRIPSNAEVLFEIELISYVDQLASDIFQNFSKDEQMKTPFEEIIKVVDSIRLTGNEAFMVKQYNRASSKYSQALRLLENTNLKNENEEKEMKKCALKLYLNISLCDLKQVRYRKSVKYARKALDIDNKNVKALYRLARSLRCLGEYEESKRQISKAHRLDPRNKEVMQELLELDEEMKKTQKNDQQLSRKMLNLTPEKKPDKSPAKETQQMVDVVREALKGFKDNNESEMFLPKNLTEEEIQSITKAAEELNLHIIQKENGKDKIIQVTKGA
ncbi:inactive peptidyl-prolyl cis-trans isomerase FKBP6 [Hydra vulgaris]|uniref:peptidylprolyl isomerase n=1 Tax=Hydra vulgaris TaxID=6087 RepID=A0ABM4D415_HYDVU